MQFLEPPIFLSGIFDELATLGPLAVRGIFDEEFEAITEAEGRRITFLVSHEIAKTCTHGTRLELGDRQFEVVGLQPIDDGQFVDLLLMELDPLDTIEFVNTNAEALIDYIPADTIAGEQIFINGDPVILGV